VINTKNEGTVNGTFYILQRHAENPNIDVLGSDIIHDSRHSEQLKRGLSYNEKTFIPMEMEASQFTLSVIETRGWSESEIQAMRKDAAEGHSRNPEWKDKSTAKSRRRVFDRMTNPR
jgi:hypothetical protein